MLAMAVHEQTGWELGVVERRHPSSGEWGWCHLGVWCPTGYPNFLDIEGRREPGEVTGWLERFGGPLRVSYLSLPEWHAVIGAPAVAAAARSTGSSSEKTTISITAR